VNSPREIDKDVISRGKEWRVTEIFPDFACVLAGFG